MQRILGSGKTKTIVVSRALHSELFSEHSSRVSSRNEFSRVGTSSEKARKTRSDPNFRKTAISETRSDPNFRKKLKQLVPTRKKFGIFESERVL
jgi:hypothetical protein